MEAKVQKRLIEYLKHKGCYVIKTKPGPGIPVGCPDIFAFLEGWWGAFEVKATAKSPYRPLQRETIEKLSQWSTCWVVHSGNIDDVILQLDMIL
jgi:Holliday junction resolvase